MRSYKMVYLLSEMLKPYGKVNTRSVNMAVWECQKQGVMEDYVFLPIGDGPLSQEILSDVAYLEMVGVVKIEDDLLKLGYYDVSEIIKRVPWLYPEEASVIGKVAGDMADRDLLLDENKILEYWRGELEKLGFDFT